MSGYERTLYTYNAVVTVRKCLFIIRFLCVCCVCVCFVDKEAIRIAT